MIKKKYIYNIFSIFLVSHLTIWTLIPYFSNINLPLDTIEHLAWASNLDWGFDKHPPLVAFILAIFYQIFSNQDWAYYLLSQIFVVSTFYIVWIFSKEFFKNDLYSLISVLLLEGLFFYNFTTPEFNVNICQLPFWALTVFYFWQSIKDNEIKNWILLGLFAGLGFLSKYLFAYLLMSLVAFLIYILFRKRNLKINIVISVITFLIIISPHIFWLIKNDFVSILYALKRTGLETTNLKNHLINPLIFLGKQIGILFPLFLIFLMSLKKPIIKFKFRDQKFLFLLVINLMPIVLMAITSLISGAKIRTMWMTPFYLYWGVMLVYLFQKNINILNLRNFFYMFLIFFTISPISYFYISKQYDQKRTDYPGKEIAYLVQQKWDKNFRNDISVIVGDEWIGGNLSYHLNSRPKWFRSLDGEIEKINTDAGFVYAGNPKVLKKICPGVYGTIKPVGFCMIGIK